MTVITHPRQRRRLYNLRLQHALFEHGFAQARRISAAKFEGEGAKYFSGAVIIWARVDWAAGQTASAFTGYDGFRPDLIGVTAPGG